MISDSVSSNKECLLRMVRVDLQCAWKARFGIREFAHQSNRLVNGLEYRFFQSSGATGLAFAVVPLP